MPAAQPPPHDRAPTVHDVARAAGVSRQTVSNVVNAPHRVAELTRARVESAIEELRYRPHRPARNLRAGRSRLLGYRVPPAPAGAINPLLDRFLHALTEAARAEGYHVLLFTPKEAQDEISAHGDLVATGTVDGFVLAETNYGDERAAYLAEVGSPFVAFGRTGVTAAHDWVDVDGAAGTRAGVEHLVASGHRRIALIGWPAGSVSGDERAAGWRAGMAAAGLSTAGLEVRGPEGVPAGQAALRALLDSADPPTAVLAVSDLLAVGVYREAGRSGRLVGRDLAVVGFDDSPLAPLLDPPLTSIRQPMEEVARRIVRMLTRRLSGGAPGEGVLLSPELVVRNSTRPDEEDLT